ncbi:MAG: hypothetical protein Q4F99_06440 [bacterium]|nr:hypothetical protein [bacterium]
MLSNRTLDILWVSILPVVLTGICDGLFPSFAVLHIGFLPIWCIWLLLTRTSKVGIWIAIWFGQLLEYAWLLPQGTCILFFLLCWSIIEAFRETLPEKFSPGMGFLIGAITTPILLLWTSIYAFIYLGDVKAFYLWPTFGQFILAPVIGSLGGALAFKLAPRCEFFALRPKIERRVVDGD